MNRPRPIFGIGLAVAVVVLGLAGFDQFGAVGAEHEVATDAAAVGSYGPAPKLTAADYPTIAGVNSRIAVWSGRPRPWPSQLLLASTSQPGLACDALSQ